MEIFKRTLPIGSYNLPFVTQSEQKGEGENIETPGLLTWEILFLNNRRIQNNAKLMRRSQDWEG